MQPVEVTNLPVLSLEIIAGAQVVFALAMIAIAIVMLMMVKQIIAILQEVQSMVSTDVRKDIMPSVAATLKNVKTISDDATTTVHNVSGTVNRVSHVVSAVATRAESPLVRAVGLISGVAAGARAVGGRKGKEKEVVVVEKGKKRRGFLGIH